ncbi:hypothetical protein [Marinilabilia sp.]|uniref:hypothetical protein n=1 Tax=Marinilabilia sp. TaxID=2021252 RepID=UPI0025C62E7A|nr:hypothetical protein [Marinilabilia sp.]
MRLKLSVFLFFAAVSLSIAQSDFRPGYVISNSQDTVFGQVDYRGDIRNMKVCTFIPTGQATEKEYYPGDVYGYRYSDNGKFYVSKFIDTDEVTDTVFVEFLLEGISNLYYYEQPQYATYLVEQENGEIYELTNEDVISEHEGKVYSTKSQRYKGVLKYAFADAPDISSRISSTNYTHESLIKVTKQYHDYVCDGEQCVIYEKNVRKGKLNVVPLLGYSISSFNPKSSFIKDDVSYDNSSSFAFGVGIDWQAAWLNEKLSIFSSLIFCDDQYIGKQDNPRWNRTYNAKSSTMTLNAALKYTYPKGKIQPTFYGGALSVFELDNELSYVDYYPTETKEFDLTEPYPFGIQAGIVLGTGLDISVGEKNKIVTQILISRTWPITEFEFLRLERTRAVFTVGYAL